MSEVSQYMLITTSLDKLRVQLDHKEAAVLSSLAGMLNGEGPDNSLDFTLGDVFIMVERKANVVYYLYARCKQWSIFAENMAGILQDKECDLLKVMLRRAAEGRMMRCRLWQLRFMNLEELNNGRWESACQRPVLSPTT